MRLPRCVHNKVQIKERKKSVGKQNGYLKNPCKNSTDLQRYSVGIFEALLCVAKQTKNWMGKSVSMQVSSLPDGGEKCVRWLCIKQEGNVSVLCLQREERAGTLGGGDSNAFTALTVSQCSFMGHEWWLINLPPTYEAYATVPILYVGESKTLRGKCIPLLLSRTLLCVCISMYI